VQADSKSLRNPALRLYLAVGKHAKQTKSRLSNMNFQCEELSISDEEFGCTITFSDSTTSEDQFMTAEEIMNSEEKYLLIQRTYPEDDDDVDNYHVETSETEVDLLSDGTEMTVEIDPERFKIELPGAQLEIGLNLTDKELENLEKTLKERFEDRLRVKNKKARFANKK